MRLLVELFELLQLQQWNMVHQVLASCSSCPLTLQLLQLDVWQGVAVSCREVVALAVDTQLQELQSELATPKNR